MSLGRRCLAVFISSTVWIPLAIFAGVEPWSRGWVCGLIVGLFFSPAWNR